MEFEPCKSVGCKYKSPKGQDFCASCIIDLQAVLGTKTTSANEPTMSQKYPQYYKSVGELKEIDVYAVHHLFDIQDPSGCIQHASKKLLLSGVRTGGKSALKDIKEARDTLTRYIQLHESAP
jgi:hypothetical protein